MGVPTKAAGEGAEETKGMSQAAKGIILEQNAEKNLVDQLFGGEEDENGEPTMSLKTEDELKNFGKKVSTVLGNSTGKTRYVTFMLEMCKNLQDFNDSRTIKKLADHLLAQYNEKLKKEKESEKGKKKQKEKAPQIKGGGAKGYERNNNAAMINDVMGNEYEDEYGEYGDYGDEGFTKEKEANYDFM